MGKYVRATIEADPQAGRVARLFSFGGPKSGEIVTEEQLHEKILAAEMEDVVDASTVKTLRQAFEDVRISKTEAGITLSVPTPGI